MLPADTAGPSPTAKHCKSGVDPKWSTDFPWLEVSESGMFCAVCKRQSRRPKKVAVGKAIWVDLYYYNSKSLVRHAESECHLLALKMEADLVSSRTHGGIK